MSASLFEPTMAQKRNLDWAEHRIFQFREKHGKLPNALIVSPAFFEVFNVKENHNLHLHGVLVIKDESLEGEQCYPACL